VLDIYPFEDEDVPFPPAAQPAQPRRAPRQHRRDGPAT
jgi:hypothetical protein